MGSIRSTYIRTFQRGQRQEDGANDKGPQILGDAHGLWSCSVEGSLQLASKPEDPKRPTSLTWDHEGNMTRIYLTRGNVGKGVRMKRLIQPE